MARKNNKAALECRPHADCIERLRQGYETRLNKVRLGMNEYVPAMPPSLYKKMMAGFSAEKASAYPEVNPAYEALAAFLSQPRDRLLLTSGADMAIKVVLETFCSPGDTIATVAPTFAMYRIHAALLDCRFKEILCRPDGTLAEKALLSLAKPGICAIVIANPNGVTGFTFSRAAVEKLSRQAGENGTLVLVDETYGDFGGTDVSPLIDECPNLVIVRSFSKNIGLAGLRIGYILTNERLSGMIEKFKPMMEINSLAVEAVKALCSDKNSIKKSVGAIIRARKNFAAAMAGLGFGCLERGGNFVLVDFGRRREGVCRILDENGIEYRKLPEPFGKYLRFTVGSDKVMRRVAALIGRQANNKE